MINQLDTQLFIWFNQILHHPWLDVFFPYITTTRHFEIPVLLIVIFVLIRGDRYLRFSLLLLLASLLVSESINQALKEAVARLRPFHVIPDARLLVGGSDSFSFPSSHASSVCSTLSIIIYRYRHKKYLPWILGIIAVLISYSRIYVGVHYPFDVLGGMFVGIGAAAFILIMHQYYPVIKNEREGKLEFNYQGMFLMLVVLFSFYRLAYITLPEHALTPEETQYWDWSRHLDWSYYSKPPLLALLIRFFTTLGGQYQASVRMTAIVISFLMGIVGYIFSFRLFKSHRIAFFSLLIFNLMPLYSAGAIVITTDTPLALFWALTIYSVYKGIFENHMLSWYYAGIWFGLGLLSKYTMVLLLPCLLLYLFLSKEHRFWLKRKEPYLSSILGLCFMAPVLYWNWKNNWVTFKHVSGQAHLQEGFVIKFKEFFDFFGSQVGVVTPLFFIGLIWVTYRVLRRTELRKNAQYLFLLCTALPVFLFFLAKSLQGKVEANWASNAYYSWVILMVAVFDGMYSQCQLSPKKRLFKGLVYLSIFMGVFMTASMHNMNIVRSLGIKIPPKKDPTARLYGWDELGSEIDQIRKRMPHPEQVFIFSDQYQLTSESAFYTPGQPYTYCINLGRRMNQYDLWKGMETQKGNDGIFVTWGLQSTADYRVQQSFDKIGVPIFVRIKKKNLVYHEFTLFQCYGYSGAIQGEINPDRF